MSDTTEASFPLKIEVNVQKIAPISPVPVELPIYKQIEISLDVDIYLNNVKSDEDCRLNIADESKRIL